MSAYTRTEWINRAPIQFQTIFEKHDMWISGMDGGERADLSGANLSDADLHRADLSGADLSGADLSGTDLHRAKLACAYLHRINLSGAKLSGADLSGANLSGANLSGANLSGANLSDADLSGADLSGAKLTDADLHRANLSGAKLSGADLSGADLSGADLTVIKEDFITSILLLPDEIPFLRKALVEGRIDGSQYNGECACLAGTMKNACGIDSHLSTGDELKNGFMAIVNSPRERWFFGINEGDTPENNQVAQITLQWIDEALSIVANKGESICAKE